MKSIFIALSSYGPSEISRLSTYNTETTHYLFFRKGTQTLYSTRRFFFHVWADNTIWFALVTFQIVCSSWYTICIFPYVYSFITDAYELCIVILLPLLIYICYVYLYNYVHLPIFRVNGEKPLDIVNIFSWKERKKSNCII